MISEPMVCSVQTVHLSCVKITLSLNGLKRASTNPPHLGVPLGASKTISEPMVCFAQTVHLCSTNSNTISKLTKTRFSRDPRHLGVPSGASKIIFRAQGTFGANCAPILRQEYTISKWTKTSFQLTHVTMFYHRVHPKRFLSLWYVWRKL